MKAAVAALRYHVKISSSVIEAWCSVLESSIFYNGRIWEWPEEQYQLGDIIIIETVASTS